MDNQVKKVTVEVPRRIGFDVSMPLDEFPLNVHVIDYRRVSARVHSRFATPNALLKAQLRQKFLTAGKSQPIQVPVSPAHTAVQRESLSTRTRDQRWLKYFSRAKHVRHLRFRAARRRGSNRFPRWI